MKSHFPETRTARKEVDLFYDLLVPRGWDFIPVVITWNESRAHNPSHARAKRIT